MNRVLVTGCVGFIGFHLTKKLLTTGYEVIGVDSSYSNSATWPEDNNPTLKKLKNDRLEILRKYKNFKYENCSIGDTRIQKIEGPLSVVHLAARAGIPFSKEKPLFFEYDNVWNFAKLLVSLKDTSINNFVYASSSSVYGGNDTPTGCTEDMTLNPLNVYANTKMYNEIQSKIYGLLYNIPHTGLRFFTVYGTYGRIDMSIYKWTKAIYNNEPVILNNSGDMYRDFTNVKDIVNGIILSLEKPQENKIYNLGRGESVKINKVVSLIEKFVGKKAIIQNAPYPVGEVYMSLSNVDLAKKELGFEPKVSISDGLEEYIDWFKKYFKYGDK